MINFMDFCKIAFSTTTIVLIIFSNVSGQAYKSVANAPIENLTVTIDDEILLLSRTTETPVTSLETPSLSPSTSLSSLPVIHFLWIPNVEDNPQSYGRLSAGLLAVQHFNERLSLSAGFSISLIKKPIQLFGSEREDHLTEVLSSIFTTMCCGGVGERSTNCTTVLGVVGPDRTVEARPVAKMMPSFNLIMISAGAMSAALSEPEFNQLFRTVNSGLNVARAEVPLLQYLNYTSLMAFYENEQHSVDYQVVFEDMLRDSRIEPKISATFWGEKGRQRIIKSILSSNERVIHVTFSASEGRRLMCAAYRAGITAAHGYIWIIYAWITPWWLPQPLLDTISVACTVAEIEQTLLGSFVLNYNKLDLSSDEPMVTGYTPAVLKQQLTDAIVRDYPNNSAPPVIGHIAYTTYEAILALGLALGSASQLLKQQQMSIFEFSYQKRLTMIMIRNSLYQLSFRGPTGRVKFGKNGDRDGRIYIDQIQVDMKMKTVGYFDEDKGLLMGPQSELRFADNSSRPPAGVFVVAFFDSTFNVVLLCVVVCVLVLIPVCVVLGWCAWRRRRFEEQLRDLNWLIHPSELLEPAESNVTQSTSTLSMLAFLNRSETMSYEYFNHRPFQVLVFRGKKTSVFVLHGSHRHIKSVTRQEMLDIKTMKDADHDNVARFLGICLTATAYLSSSSSSSSQQQQEFDFHRATASAPSDSIVMQYGSKGTFQDLLMNESIELDATLGFLMINDVAQGVKFVHQEFGYHGRLRSNTIIIDNRLVSKVSDYGLPSFRAMLSSDGERELLWTAPELLRQEFSSSVLSDVGEKVMSLADTFSFGIVLSEVLTRHLPYGKMQDRMSISEILRHVREDATNTPHPFRPAVSASLDDAKIPSQLVDLMRRCLSEQPDQRPRIVEAGTEIGKLMKLFGISDNITESMLDRMRRYAITLENVVRERTGELIESKNRAESLLYAMLPAKVVKQLQSGAGVEPESFECVTVYFSDIVGFTALSSNSTPLEVIKLLNDLYGMFDATCQAYDVYKVETIGDAYMVASGLPEPNGNEHSRQIALLSLHIMRAAKHFIIQHRPNDSLRIRVGINSGPCATGVVGHAMPRYCVYGFGDTVNTASRMESTSLPNCIQVSETTKLLLDTFDEFTCEERGRMVVKGKGSMTTYWLITTKTSKSSTVEHTDPVTLDTASVFTDDGE